MTKLKELGVEELGYEVGSTMPASITPIAQTEIVIAVSASVDPNLVEPIEQ